MISPTKKPYAWVNNPTKSTISPTRPIRLTKAILAFLDILQPPVILCYQILRVSAHIIHDARFLYLPPKENTQACQENAKPVCYGDHHCAVKELLEIPDYLARRVGKTGFSERTRNFIDGATNKASMGSEGPLRAFWCKARRQQRALGVPKKSCNFLGLI